MSSSSSSSESSSSSDETSIDFNVKGKSDESDEEDMKMPTPQPDAASMPPRPFPISKGSRSKLITKTATLFDRKRTHYQYLHKQGLYTRKRDRAARRKLRDTLKNDEEAKHYPTLQSSSSEDSDSEDSNSDWERETPDWQAMAQDSWWAKENLFQILPVAEISSLVGWATHGDAPVARREQVNPLVGLPNAPLPPSHLQYLNAKARACIEKPVHQPDSWKSHTFFTTLDSSDDEPDKQLRKGWQQWDHDSEDETYQSLKGKRKPDEVTLRVPRPGKKVKKDTSHLYGVLDDSAMVALGMVWEDMITASLMPLARQHVARCRRLEQRAADDSDDKTDDVAHLDPFQEWTLPPEQAIWRLAQEGVKSELPSTQPPTRVPPHQCFDRESSVKEMLTKCFGRTPDQQQQQAVNDWCHAHGLDPAFVRNNMDLYGVCLPLAPTVERPSKQKTVREKEDRSSAIKRKTDNLYYRSRKTAPAAREPEESTAPVEKKDKAKDEMVMVEV